MDTITFDDNAHDNMFVLEIGKEATLLRAFAQWNFFIMTSFFHVNSLAATVLQ